MANNNVYFLTKSLSSYGSSFNSVISKTDVEADWKAIDWGFGMVKYSGLQGEYLKEVIDSLKGYGDQRVTKKPWLLVTNKAC